MKAASNSGRWLQVLDPHAPLADAAHILLQARLDELRRRLGLDYEGAAPERVRRLRVAARRAVAALRVFQRPLQVPGMRRLRRQVNALRRTAGDVRDCDVQAAFLDGLLGKAPADRRPALEQVIESIERLRAKREQRLRDVIERSGAVIPRASRRLLRAIQSEAEARAGRNGRQSSSLLDVARAPLSRLARDAAGAAAQDLSIDEHLHDLRLACKRLRYGLELFAGCFPGELRTDLYPVLAQVQERIGAATDIVAVMRRLRSEAARAEGRQNPDTAAALEDLVTRYRAIYDARARDARAYLDATGFDALRRTERLIADAVGFSSARQAPRPPRAGLPPRLRPSNGRAPRDTPRRMAVIDVGTNSIRLEVVEAFPDRTYRVLNDAKETARLGAGMLRSGRLTDDAMERAVAAIARMAAIAAGHGVQPARLRAIGTFAIRAASNQNEFLSLVRDRTGLEITVLSPEQEAKLAFASADHAMDLSQLTSAVVDIGGGSTEIVLSALGIPEQVHGLPLGAMLLTELFGGPESSSLDRFREMRRHIDRSLRRGVGRPILFPQLVAGTGGTFTVLANILGASRGSSGPQLWDRRAGFEATRSDIKHLVERIRRVPLADRASIPGLPADRADIIVAGFTLIERVLKHLRANSVRIHDRGIRDGFLLSMIAEAYPDAIPGRADPIAAVRRLAQKCNYEQPHSEHVTTLALQVFDDLARPTAPEGAESAPEPAPDWATPRSRLLLEAAAILHDIGYLVSFTAHHKHSYHLIIHSDLAAPGLFSPREVELIAQIARYHRRAEPRRSHEAFEALPAEDREIVRRLAGILRIADGLDRAHNQLITSAHPRIDSGRCTFTLAAAADRTPGPAADPGANLHGAMEKRTLFEEVFNVMTDFRPIEADAAPRSGAAIEE